MNNVLKPFIVVMGKDCELCVTKEMLKQALVEKCGHPIKDFEVYNLKDLVSLTTFVNTGQEARATIEEKELKDIEILRGCNETH